MKRLWLVLLLSSLSLAQQPDPFLAELPSLRQLLYRDPAAFARAFSPWEARLSDWTPGASRAACLELRAQYRASQNDRAGEIANLQAALQQPDLEAGWKFRCRLDLPTAHLYHKDHPAYQQVLEQALREGPAQLNSGEVRQLLALKNEEAAQRGDSTFNLLYLQMLAQQFPGLSSRLRLAEWYRDHGRPDGHLEWWQAARDALPEDADHRQWGVLWRAAPAEQKEWALQQQLLRLQSLSPLEQARARVAIASAMQGQQSARADIEKVLAPALVQLEQTPDSHFRVYEDLAGLHRAEPERAVVYLRQALQVGRRENVPQLGRLYFSLASSLEDGQRREEGLAIFREGLQHALEHEPDEVQRFLYRAISAATYLNQQEAVEQLRALVLQHLPRMAPDRQGLALEALLRSYPKDQSEARAQVLTRMRVHYQRRMQECRQQQNWEAYAQAGRGLAQTLGYLGDFRGQGQILQELLGQTIPQPLREIVEEELLSQMVHQNDPGAEVLAHKLRQEPDERRRRIGLENLVRLYRRREQWPAVLQLIQQCPAEQLTSELLHERYAALEKLGRWQEAWQALETWEKAFPPGPTAQSRSLFERARLAAALRQPEQARNLAEQGYAALLKHPEPLTAANYLATRPQDWRPRLERLLEVMPLAQRNQLLVHHALNLARAGKKSEGRRLLRENQVSHPELAAEYPEFAPAQEPLSAVLDRLRLARPDLEPVIPLHSTNLARLQAHLAEDQWLVAYLPGPEEILRVTLTRHAQSYHKLPFSPSLLDKQIEQDWQALAAHRRGGRCL